MLIVFENFSGGIVHRPHVGGIPGAPPQTSPLMCPTAAPPVRFCLKCPDVYHVVKHLLMFKCTLNHSLEWDKRTYTLQTIGGGCINFWWRHEGQKIKVRMAKAEMDSWGGSTSLSPPAKERCKLLRRGSWQGLQLKGFSAISAVKTACLKCVCRARTMSVYRQSACVTADAGLTRVYSTLALVLPMSTTLSAVGWRVDNPPVQSCVDHTTDRRPAWNKCRLNHYLECISSFNTHLSHSRPRFNIMHNTVSESQYCKRTLLFVWSRLNAPVELSTYYTSVHVRLEIGSTNETVV